MAKPPGKQAEAGGDERPIPESYWVIPGKLLAGEYPGHHLPEKARQRVDAFLQEGFDTFIDLTQPGETVPYQPILNEQARIREIEVRYMRLPIGDFGIPPQAHMAAILDAIDDSLAQGRKVYLHCYGGIGRTGTTVGCYLARHGLNGAQALRKLAEWWQHVPKSRRFLHSPETRQQEEYILNWKEG